MMNTDVSPDNSKRQYFDGQTLIEVEKGKPGVTALYAISLAPRV